MELEKLNPEFFQNNRNKIIELMQDRSLLFLSGNPVYFYNPTSSFNFRQNPDFYYLTGINFPDCSLLIYNKAEGIVETVLYIPQVTDFQRQWDSELLEKEEAIKISGITNVEFSPYSWKKALNNYREVSFLYLKKIGVPNKAGFEYHKKVVSQISRYFPNSESVEVTPILEKVRLIKEDVEVSQIKRAIEITGYSLQNCLSNLDQYKNESNFHHELVFEFMKNGGDGIAFDPIIASGKNASVLHYISNNNDFKSGDMVLTDIGARYSQYNADITRSFPYGGVSKRYKDIFTAVYEVYIESLKLVRPGISIRELNTRVAEFVEEKLLFLRLIALEDIKKQDSKNPAYRKYYMHSASHFLGLEVHDVGNRDEILRENMVITLEPGLYVPEENIGIRLENDLLITANGSVELSAQIPMHWEDLLDWANS